MDRSKAPSRAVGLGLPVAYSVLAWSLLASSLAACSSDAPPPNTNNAPVAPSVMGTGTTGSVDLPGDTGDNGVDSFIPEMGGKIENVTTNQPGVCGNGKVDKDEACDDGNLTPGDGCPADCLVVEPHWACDPGRLCVYISYCGDGAMGTGESCDDANAVGGDGCSDLCQRETDWICPTAGMPCQYAVVCGDSLLGGVETCDDGNANPGDGCGADCQTELGWVCSGPGTKCIEACGDATVIGREDCDDGNLVAGDGCSATCSSEVGFECDMPGAPCRATVCGDGVVEGGEPCDDQNNALGDGCSPGCKYEPDCTGMSGCRSRCGDGMILPGDVEECDDGNAKDGDGCSATCVKEIGFDCVVNEVNSGNTLTLPIVYRDFIGEGLDTVTNENGVELQSYRAANGHADFEHMPYSRAAGEYSLEVFHAVGLAETQLSPEGRPVYAARSAAAQEQTSTKENFDQWFMDVPGVNVTLLAQIDLTRNGAQNPYVFDDATFFPLDNLPGTLVETGEEQMRNVDWDGKGCWKPLLQRHQCEGDEACEVGGNDLEPYQGCPMADNYPDCVDKHNFSFTSELRYWFEYKGGEQLVFRGDDDVFVYINRRLVVDLGGLHEPLGADVCGQVWGEAVRDPDDWDTDGDGDGYDHQVLLDEDGNAIEDEPDAPCDGLSAATTDVDGNPLNLVEGTVYEVALFQAERHTCQSNYRLSLSGFTKRSSACMATCGDGMVASTEVCDEGAMNGTGYGHCTTSCTPGPRCGDGIFDQGFEACDNGVNGDGYYLEPDDCAPGCVLPPFCGDGNVDAAYTEQCDFGANNNNTAYGGCTLACQLGPRCGDGFIQPDVDAEGAPFEECDDGNIANNDGCSITCKKEPKFTVK